VLLEHTLFLDLLKLFVNMRLALSFAGRKKIVFFGPTEQKLWVFEVSRRSLGRAGMCWSQPARVDHLHKSGGQEGKTFQEKWELPHRRRCRPATSGRLLVARRPRVDTCVFGTVQIFLKFFYLKEKNFWKFG
jgi:hypothetical protein